MHLLAFGVGAAAWNAQTRRTCVDKSEKIFRATWIWLKLQFDLPSPKESSKHWVYFSTALQRNHSTLDTFSIRWKWEIDARKIYTVDINFIFTPLALMFQKEVKLEQLCCCAAVTYPKSCSRERNYWIVIIIINSWVFFALQCKQFLSSAIYLH